jgi:hypothetical protein
MECSGYMQAWSRRFGGSSFLSLLAVREALVLTRTRAFPIYFLGMSGGVSEVSDSAPTRRINAVPPKKF